MEDNRETNWEVIAAEYNSRRTGEEGGRVGPGGGWVRQLDEIKAGRTKQLSVGSGRAACGGGSVRCTGACRASPSSAGKGGTPQSCWQGRRNGGRVEMKTFL